MTRDWLNTADAQKCPSFVVYFKTTVSNGQCKINLPSIPEQLKPSPEQPGSHAHMYDPIVLLQAAFAWQGFVEHSSISKMDKKGNL